MAHIQSPYLTQTEAAQYLRTTIRTLIRWERDGLVRAFRPTKRKKIGGGIVLYKIDDLRAFIEQGTAAAAKPKRGRPRKTE